LTDDFCFSAIDTRYGRLSTLRKSPTQENRETDSNSVVFRVYFFLVGCIFLFCLMLPLTFAWLVVWNVNDDDGTGVDWTGFLAPPAGWEDQTINLLTVWTKLSERVTCPTKRGGSERKRGVVGSGQGGQGSSSGRLELA